MNSRIGAALCLLVFAWASPSLKADSATGTALVRHAPSINGTVEGSIQQMMGESLVLNGGGHITQDLLLPGTPTVRLNGRPTYAGTVDAQGSASPSNYQVTLNGNSSLRHVVRRTNPVALPVVATPLSPTGTRTVVINSRTGSAGSFATLRNLMLNGGVGQFAIPAGRYGDFTANGGSGFTLGSVGATQPSAYHFQRLTLNGQSQLKVVGPVIITVASGFSANGSLGASNTPEWLVLNVKSGGFTLNGGCSVYGHVNVPNGTVIINGNSALHGGLTADRLIINGGGMLRLRPAAPSNRAPVASPATMTVAEDESVATNLTATDADADALTYTIVSVPAHGVLTGAAPQLTYTPHSNYHGPDAFTFRANDGSVDSNLATITIDVAPVNDAPTASEATINATEDSPQPVNLVATDIEGDALTFEVVRAPSHGVLTGSGANPIYIPDANYHGQDSFEFIATDAVAASRPALVSLEVTPVNDAPVANGGHFTVAEGETLPITLQAADVDGDVLSYSILSSPMRGALSGTAPHLSYTPPANFSGTETIRFQATDGIAASASAEITIKVSNRNDAPTALSATATTSEDVSVRIAVTGHDPDSDALLFNISQLPQHGTLVREQADGDSSTAYYLYTPERNYHGADSFTFSVNDGLLESPVATVAIDIAPTNDVPTASDLVLVQDQDTTFEFTLPGADIDGEVLTYTIVTPPTHGALTGTAPHLTYTPEFNYRGEDTLTFKVADGSGESSNATVRFTMNAVPHAPVSQSQTIALREDESAAVVLSATDLDGDVLTYTVVSGPAHGTLTGTADELTYAPNVNYFGSDHFTFKVSDGALDSQVAHVTLEIAPVNDAPTATSQTITLDEDSSTAVTLTGADPDGDGLSFSILVQPAHGTLTGTPPNQSYVPARDFAGEDQFTFRVSDGSIESEPGIVLLNIRAVNDAPVVLPGVVSASEDTPTTIVISASDPEGDAIGYRVTEAPQHGTLSGVGPEFTYSPAPNYHGTDTFAVAAHDGHTDSPPAAVSVTVLPENDAPTAASISFIQDQDTSFEFTLAASDVDGDALTFVILAPPETGQLSGTAPHLRYTPHFNYRGDDVLVFRANDGTADSGEATVRFTMRAVPHAPVALSQTIATREDESAAIVLGATDLDGDGLSYVVVTGPEHGTLTGTGGELVYTPTADYFGNDSFTFKASDGALESEVASVAIDIAPVNDAPVGYDQTVTLEGNGTIEIRLSGHDVDGDELEFTVSAMPEHGVLTGSGPVLIYSPAPAYQGSDSFTFLVSDGLATSTVVGTVSILVSAPANQAPLVNAGPDTTAAFGPSSEVKPYGNIVLNHDEWTLTDEGFSSSASAGAFAVNLAKWFTGGKPGKFLAYTKTVPGSVDFAYTGAALRAVMENAGHEWVTSSTIPFTVENLRQFDAVFLCANQVDNLVLIDYVNAGGSVYLSAGTKWCGCEADVEASWYATFLNAFGLAYGHPYNGVRGSLPVQSTHPIFEGLSTLYYNNGNPVIVLDPENPLTSVVNVHDGRNLMALYSRSAVAASLVITGAVSDDGLPDGSALTYRWSKLAGPDLVYFEDESALTTRVSFASPGIYTLQLSASDGEHTSTDTVVITVERNEAPQVFAGGDAAVRSTTEPFQPKAIASDDGIPRNASLTFEWRMVDGPAEVQFSDPAALQPVILFPADGVYVLEITASDAHSESRSYAVVRVGVGYLAAPSGMSAWWPGNGHSREMVTGEQPLRTQNGAKHKDGKVSLAFDFDGVNDHWKANAGPSTAIGADVDSGGATIEFWINMADHEADRAILAWKGGPHLRTTYYSLRLSVSWGKPGGGDGFESSDVLAAGVWSHCAVTYERASGLGRIYHNGVLVGERSIGSFALPTTDEFVLGFRSGNSPFKGQLDEITLYNRVLTPEEIGAAYLAGSAGKVLDAGNEAPKVSAGPDVTIDGVEHIGSLNGSVSDDGKPAGARVDWRWSKVSGPGEVAFAAASGSLPDPAATTAQFSAAGLYTLKLESDDGAYNAKDLVEVRVGQLYLASLPDDVQAWWPANGDATEVRTGRRAMPWNVPGFAEGRVGQAFALDGVDDYWRAAAAPEWAVGSASDSAGATIECWIKMADHEKDRVIFSWGNGPYLRTNYYSTRLLVGWGKTGGGDTFESGGVLVAGEWAHCVATYDRATGTARLFVNGVHQNAAVIGSFPLPTTGDFLIGAGGGFNRFKGHIDEVTLYDRALSPAEIGALYQSGLAGKPPLNADVALAVSAGPDVSVRKPGDTALLTASFGAVNGSLAESATWRWSKLSGPGEVTFGNEGGGASDSPSTSVQCATPGIYVLKLEGRHNSRAVVDLVEVRVGQLYPAELPVGAKAWWPGNGTGIDVYSRHEATAWNLAGFGGGHISEAFVFDGVDDRWSTSRPEYAVGADPGSKGASIELWMNFADHDRDRAIVSWANGPYLRTTYYSVRLQVGWGKSGGEDVFETANILESQTWTHCVATYDRETGLARLYVNGVLEAQKSIGSFVLPTAGEFSIGSRATNYPFKGALDEITLYDRPLTPDEVSAIYEAGAMGKPPADGNTSPAVSAGPDLSVAAAPGTAHFAASIEDDGLPAGIPIAWRWTQIAGPAIASLSSQAGMLPDGPSTSAQLSEPGLYLFRLDADDGSALSSDFVEVRVAQSYPTGLPADYRAWWPGNGNAVEVLTGDRGIRWNLPTFADGLVAKAFTLPGSGYWAARQPEFAVGSSPSDPGATVEFWLKMDDHQANRGILSWTNGPSLRTNYYSTRLQVDWGKSGDSDTFETGNILEAGMWFHCAATYDRATGIARLYINGVGQISKSIGSFDLPTTEDFRIGAVGGAPTFKGQLDEVTLYNRALTAAEVATIYSAGAAGKPMPEINGAPMVTIGSPQTITAGIAVQMTGVVVDDGRPNPPGSLTYEWSVISGPGSVEFSNLNAVSTLATFGEPGEYIVQLASSDSVKVGTGSVTLVVEAPPSTPPEIEFVEPAQGSALVESTYLELAVRAVDSDGTIVKVEFFQDGSKIGEQTAPAVNDATTYFWPIPGGLSVGSYVFGAKATDDTGVSAEATLITVAVVTDPGPATASIATPSADARISAPTSFTGVVNSSILRTWTLERRFKAPDSGPTEPWTIFASGNADLGSPEAPDVLGTFDPTNLINGIYEVRLVATDTTGRSAIDGPITVVVEGNMKIGAFTLAFEDLKIPTAGIPITVTRTYDSRDTRIGDFGPGWRIAVNNIRVQKNRHLGDAWWQTPQEGNGIQFYDVLPIDERIVTVVFPDGETHRFRAGALVKNRAGDPDYRSFGVPVSRGKFRFYPIGDTTSSLEPLNDSNELIEDFWIDGTGDQDLRADDPAADPFAENFDASRFRLTTADGTVFILDESLGLLEMHDLNGNTVVLNRDTQQRVSTIVSTHAAPSGPIATTITIHRDATGRVDYITDPSGNDLDYGYDDDGRLDTFTDRVLNTTQFRYENDAFPNYLTKVIDPRGVPALRSEFDDEGRLFKQIDAEGKETVFDRGIDSTGRFEKVSDRLGKPTTFYYDERGNVTLKIDPLEARTSYDYYPDSDRVKFEIDHYGNVKSFAYDARGNVTAETLGASLADDPANPATGYTTRTVYNGKSAPTQITDPDGRVQTFSYDPTTNDLLTHTIGFGGPAPATTTYTYYTDGTLYTITDALGNVTTHVYDYAFADAASPSAVKQTTVSVVDPAGALGSDSTNADATLLRSTRMLYDDQENQVAQIVTRTLPDGATEDVITRFRYDAENRLVATIQPDGRVQETRYTSFGQEDKSLLWKSVADYESGDDLRARVTSYGYDSRGNRNSITYADGTGESMHFDEENRKQWSEDRRGFRTSFIYDDVGRLRFTVHPDATPADEADNPRSETIYDLVGRVTHQIDELGHVTEFTYENNCGCAMRRREMIQHVDGAELVTSYEYDRAGNVRFVTDPRSNTVETRYDDHGRPTKVIHPATDEHPATASETHYDALGRRIAAIDQEGKITRYRHDALGRLVEVRQYLGQATADADASFALSAAHPEVIATSYSYDELGNQRTQTDALGRVTTYWTDSLGRRTQRILPKDASEATALSENLEYDEWGNLWKRTDFAGHTTTFTYDALNRLKSKIADAAHPSLAYSHSIARIEYDYDANGVRTAARTYSASDAMLYSESTPRDERGRIDYKDTAAGQLDYSYYANGTLKDVVSSNSNGVNVGYRYDALNRLEHVDDTSTGLPVRTTSYTYNANGSLETVTYPNTVMHAYSYDTLNRLRALNITAGAAPLHAYDYQLRASGHRRQVVEGPRTITYGYDNIYRLTEETRVGDANGNSGTIGYSLDKVGNRTSRLSSLAAISNQANTFNARDWLDGDVYTPNGSTQTSSQLSALDPQLAGTDTYDFEERLIVRMKPDGSTINVSYDADGHRVGKTTLSPSSALQSSTHWLVDTNNLTGYAQVLEERITTASDTTIRIYTYGSDLISQATSLNDQPATLHYFVYDGHGSVRELTDNTGTTTDHYDYDAFGGVVHQTGATANMYRYAGEQYDPDLGLYYNRARYLNTDSGRFWSMDNYEGAPEDPASLHKYIYANVDPVNGIDPSGNMTLFEVSLTQIIDGIKNTISVPTGAYVRKKGIKKLACVVGVSAAERWMDSEFSVHGHHPIPKSHGGGDELLFLPASTHRAFHFIYNVFLRNDPTFRALGLHNSSPPGDWEQAFKRNPKLKKAALQILKKAARVVDKHCALPKGLSLETYIKKNERRWLRGG